MDLDELDRMINDRKQRIDKRKSDGTLFEDEVVGSADESEDARLEQQVQDQKKKMMERLKAQIPPCPQCGVKMTLLEDQGMIACQACGVGMRI